MSSLGRAGARGGLITVLGQSIKIVLQLGLVVILARILPPDVFGSMAIVLAIAGIGELFRDFGLSSAAVQSERLSNDEKSSLFFLNVLIGLFLALALFVSAPGFSSIFDEETLTPILRVLSIIFILNAIQAQFKVEMIRDLRFSSLTLTEIWAYFFAALVTVGMALAGFGIWALVGQQLAISLALTVLRIGMTKWRPRGRFHPRYSRRFLNYGWNLAAAQSVGYAASNADSVVLGMTAGPYQLGIYSRAFQLLMAPVTQVLSPLTNVALPILSKVQGSKDRFNRFVLTLFVPVGYISVLFFGIVSSASESIVDILLGREWYESAPVLSILAFGGVFQFMNFVGYWIFLSRGLTGDLLRYNLITKSLTIGLVIVGSNFGIVGVATGYSASLALSFPIVLLWLHRISTIPIRWLIYSSSRMVLLFCLVYFIGHLISLMDLYSWMQIIFVFICATVLFVFISCIPGFRTDRRYVVEALSLVRSKQ